MAIPTNREVINMTTTKVYVNTFTSKAQANAYYYKIKLQGNLTSKGMGRLAGQGLWEVRRVYTVATSK